MTVRYRPPAPLGPEHSLERFVCGSAEQTHWLRQRARQSGSGGTTRVFVVTEHRGNDVVAYYAWCMASVTPEALPLRARRGAGRYPQPVALLARLGVHQEHESRGLGAGLLADSIARLVSLSDSIGCRGLLIHAETEQARDFYLHLVPEFQPSPTDELHLLLLMKDARRTLLDG